MKRQKVSKVGIFATTRALKRRMYEDILNRSGIAQVAPDDFERAKIGKIINNIVLNRHANKDRQELLKIIDNFTNKGVKRVILACTDLQLLIPHHPKLKIYDREL